MTDEATEREWPIGTKVVPNKLHSTQFRRSGVKAGEIVGYPRWGRGVRVKWNEHISPDSLHVDYLNKVP